jgi:hypothetical protein
MNKRRIGELSLKRISKGVWRRIQNIPHKLSWNISSEAKTNRADLLKFKNIHEGKRCFLIANGPSLLKTDLSMLKNETTFGLNRIYLNYENMGFKPDYLVCINKLVLKQFAKDFDNDTMPKFLNWQSRKDTRFINNVHFVEMNFLATDFSKDIAYSLTPSATVTYAALQIIYYMGFKEVVIVGMDHSFQYHGKPNEAQKRKDEQDVNHFSPNYFPKGSKWETPDLVATEYSYSIAKNEFEKDDRKIYDATVDGKCTIFDKRNLESFFES